MLGIVYSYGHKPYEPVSGANPDPKTIKAADDINTRKKRTHGDCLSYQLPKVPAQSGAKGVFFEGLCLF